MRGLNEVKPHRKDYVYVTSLCITTLKQDLKAYLNNFLKTYPKPYRNKKTKAKIAIKKCQ